MNLSTRPFYRTLVQVEVLSERPLGSHVDIGELAREIIEGDFSGRVSVTAEHKLTGAEAAEALLKQGSDPAFFGLTNAGEDEA